MAAPNFNLEFSFEGEESVATIASNTLEDVGEQDRAISPYRYEVHNKSLVECVNLKTFVRLHSSLWTSSKIHL